MDHATVNKDVQQPTEQGADEEWVEPIGVEPVGGGRGGGDVTPVGEYGEYDSSRTSSPAMLPHAGGRGGGRYLNASPHPVGVLRIPTSDKDPLMESVKKSVERCDLVKCLDTLHDAPSRSITPHVILLVLKKCSEMGNMGAAIEVLELLLPKKNMRLPIGDFTTSLSHLSQRSPVGKVRELMALSEKILDFGPEHHHKQHPQLHKMRNEYCSHFLRLLVLEFLEEAAMCWEKLNSFPIAWLEDQGLCATELVIDKPRSGVVTFRSEKRGHGVSAAPASVVKGDSVLLSAMSDKEKLKCPTEIEAEVSSVTPNLQVRLIGMPNNFSSAEMQPARWRMDKMANRVTFSRQLEGIKNLVGPRPKGKQSTSSTADPIICNSILSSGCLPSSKDYHKKDIKPKMDGKIEAMCASTPSELVPHKVQKLSRAIDQTEDLNSSQRNAIKAALSRRITLVHGPPGTGKTHTAVSIVQAWLEAGQSPVLCTSDSNTAVDNLVSGLAHAGIDVLRIGRPETVRGDLNQYTLDYETADMKKDTPDDRKQIHLRQKERLKKVRAVCATCSGSGSDILDRMTFRAVLLDEASQATEPSCIIPIMHGAQQVALVGDHRQLPPTIISREADNCGLGISLFDRLVRAGVSAHLLDTQYRMHPALMLYPSQCFYNNTVRSGVPSAMREPAKGFKWPVLGVPAAFVPVDNGQDSQEGTSQINKKEAERVAACANQLLTMNSDLKPSNIGIITPYASQVRLLRNMLSQHRSTGETDKESPEVGLEINSVDGFQGREKEVILVSAVRANKQGDVGFLSDVRRMNVTLTRARRGLIVFGHTPTLRHDTQCWNPWLLWCYSCGLVVGHNATDPVASAALSKVDAQNVSFKGVCNAPPKLHSTREDDGWTCVPPCSSINELEDEICGACGKPRPEDVGITFQPDENENEEDSPGGGGALREPPPCDWDGEEAPPPCDWDEDLPEDVAAEEKVEAVEEGPANTNTYVELNVAEPAAPFQKFDMADFRREFGGTDREREERETPVATESPAPGDSASDGWENEAVEDAASASVEKTEPSPRQPVDDWGADEYDCGIDSVANCEPPTNRTKVVTTRREEPVRRGPPAPAPAQSGWRNDRARGPPTASGFQPVRDSREASTASPSMSATPSVSPVEYTGRGGGRGGYGAPPTASGGRGHDGKGFKGGKKDHDDYKGGKDGRGGRRNRDRKGKGKDGKDGKDGKGGKDGKDRFEEDDWRGGGDAAPRGGKDSGKGRREEPREEPPRAASNSYDYSYDPAPVARPPARAPPPRVEEERGWDDEPDLDAPPVGRGGGYGRPPAHEEPPMDDGKGKGKGFDKGGKGKKGKKGKGPKGAKRGGGGGGGAGGPPPGRNSGVLDDWCKSRMGS